MVATLGAVGLFLACTGATPLEDEPFRRTEPIADVGPPLGAEACMECHGHQPAPRHHLDCEGCHGSGARHVQNVLDPAHVRYPANSVCQECHEAGHRSLRSWPASEHARAGLLCADCHDPHNGEPFHLRENPTLARNLLPQARPGTRLCLGCHADVGAQLNLPSHHPVREGMLGCIDCHAPHASQDARLGLETARCGGCHQAQIGPWIYEHSPVEEDCAYCHVPHGAVADYLLDATQPGLCVYCHSVAEAGAVHDPQAYVTRCTDCHLAIHGSYADPHLRR